MYALKNKVQLIGRLGQNPEIRTISEGKKVAHLSMATSETYKNDKGVKITDTQWHRLVAWGKLADLAEKYLSKGSELAIEGKLTYSQYTDKTGVKKYMTEIQVAEILLLGTKDTKEE